MVGLLPWAELGRREPRELRLVRPIATWVYQRASSSLPGVVGLGRLAPAVFDFDEEFFVYKNDTIDTNTNKLNKFQFDVKIVQKKSCFRLFYEGFWGFLFRNMILNLICLRYYRNLFCVLFRKIQYNVAPPHFATKKSLRLSTNTQVVEVLGGIIENRKID